MKPLIRTMGTSLRIARSSSPALDSQAPRDNFAFRVFMGYLLNGVARRVRVNALNASAGAVGVESGLDRQGPGDLCGVTVEGAVAVDAEADPVADVEAAQSVRLS